jgi:hypothetical protein
LSQEETSRPVRISFKYLGLLTRSIMVWFMPKILKTISLLIYRTKSIALPLNFGPGAYISAFFSFIFLSGIFSDYLKFFINTASSAAPQIPLSRKMLGSKPGLLQH